VSDNQMELIAGTNRNVSLSQWFTQPSLAHRFVKWAKVDTYGIDGRLSQRVLEPAAGNGGLVRPLLAAGCEVVAVEIDERFADVLSTLLRKPCNSLACPTDFLQIPPGSPLLGRFDCSVQNTPFEATPACPLGQDVAFVLHALEFAPRVCGLFRSAIQHGIGRKEGFWSKVRMTRKVDLMERPNFDKDGQNGNGAQSDFILAEMWKRDDRELKNIPDTMLVERW
jgi:predicted RNA methylase